MPFTENNGVRLHWETQGEGTPVLLVMGHRFSGEMWYPVVPALTPKHQVVWFDNRGTGQSGSTNDATIYDLAADAFAVMDAAGVDSAHIFGVSMGGVIVEEMAMSKPQRVRSLIVGCSGILAADVPRSKRYLDVATYIPARWVINKFRDSMYGPAAPKDAVDRDIAKLLVEKINPRGVIAQSKALRTYSTTPEAVARIDKPTLVLHGTVDTTVPYDKGVELANTIPGARLVTFEGAGHNFIVADTELCNKELSEFIDSVDHR